ncbi:MAG TPA: hypothetical protein VG346_01025 [Acidimicrobiales bacterium]|nr:hypothetical protein [Acidimicrobiales bacterium]
MATSDEVLRGLHDPVANSSETDGDRPYGNRHSGTRHLSVRVTRDT